MVFSCKQAVYGFELDPVRAPLQTLHKSSPPGRLELSLTQSAMKKAGPYCGCCGRI
jgi:hypothetical protein